jgi:hypothetical protein
VNGKLFEEPLTLAAFDTKMREMLLEACAFVRIQVNGLQKCSRAGNKRNNVILVNRS